MLEQVLVSVVAGLLLGFIMWVKSQLIQFCKRKAKARRFKLFIEALEKRSKR